MLTQRRKSLIARYMTDPSEWDDMGPLPDEDDHSDSGIVAATVSSRRALPTIVDPAPAVRRSRPVIPAYRRPAFALTHRSFWAEHPELGWCLAAASVALLVGILLPQL